MNCDRTFKGRSINLAQPTKRSTQPFPLSLPARMSWLPRMSATLAERLGHLDMFDLATLRKWAAMDPGTIQQHLQQLTDLSKQTEMIAQGPLDPELFATMRDSVARISELNQHIAAMDAYVQSTQSIFGFLAFGKKKAAAQILAPYGLALSKENAERVRDFLLRSSAAADS